MTGQNGSSCPSARPSVSESFCKQFTFSSYFSEITFEMGWDVGPLVLFWSLTILKLHRMILDMAPHNRSIPAFKISGHLTQEFGRTLQHFLSHWSTISKIHMVIQEVCTIAQHPISRFPDKWSRNGVRRILVFRISDVYWFNLLYSELVWCTREFHLGVKLILTPQRLLSNF